MTNQEIERRLQLLEDVEAIKNLKNRYCYWCDANYDAANIASCFTEDGISGRRQLRLTTTAEPRSASSSPRMLLNSCCLRCTWL